MWAGIVSRCTASTVELPYSPSKARDFVKKGSLRGHLGIYTCIGKMVFLASIDVSDAVRKSKVPKVHLLVPHVLRLSV